MASTKSGDVSWITCRYMCDSERHHPCIGFTYRSGRRSAAETGQNLRASAVDSADATSVTADGGNVKKRPAPPKCVLMITACDFVAEDSAVTYFKGQQQTNGRLQRDEQPAKVT
jgi:hypothetical protein